MHSGLSFTVDYFDVKQRPDSDRVPAASGPQEPASCIGKDRNDLGVVPWPLQHPQGRSFGSGILKRAHCSSQKTVAAISYSSSRHLLRLKKSLRFHLPRFASRSAVCIFQESGLSTARFSLLNRKNRRSTRQRGVCLSDLFIVIECETRGCGTFYLFRSPG